MKQLGQHVLNTHPVQARFQAWGGGWGWSHTDKLSFHETCTWTPQPQGDKAPPPALPPRADEVKLVGGLRSSVTGAVSFRMEPFSAVWAMERPRLSGRGHRRRSGADAGSVCPGAGRGTALCVRFLTGAVWRVFLLGLILPAGVNSYKHLEDCLFFGSATRASTKNTPHL